MKQKSDDLLWVSFFWIGGIAASIWFLTYLGQSLLVELLPTTTGASLIGPTISIDNGIFTRLILVFPALYAVYFSVAEFRATRRLKESYDFKLCVAESLTHYSSMIYDAREDKTGSQKFLMNTIQDLLTSSADKLFEFRSKEDIESSVKKMVDGMVDTVTSAQKVIKD